MSWLLDAQEVTANLDGTFTKTTFPAKKPVRRAQVTQLGVTLDKMLAKLDDEDVQKRAEAEAKYKEERDAARAVEEAIFWRTILFWVLVVWCVRGCCEGETERAQRLSRCHTSVRLCARLIVDGCHGHALWRSCSAAWLARRRAWFSRSQGHQR